MPVTNIRGVNINWQVIGETGPWIMLTTGGRRGHDEFIPLAKKLAGLGHRVALHDRRNTGASDVLIAGAESEEVIWTEDMYALMQKLGALPAFFGGSSSGARTSILFALRHPEAVRGLLLMRITGGAFAAGRLPDNYYGQFIRAAQAGGMDAVCATEQWSERIAANPRNGEYLRSLAPEKFIAVLTRWKEAFEAGVHLPVMGVTDEELGSIRVPTLVIPGNDKTHSSASGLAAHRLIPGSQLHQLPIEDQDVPLIPFGEWSPYEDEIATVVTRFIKDVTAGR
ncbi:MAG: alpha/beta hydrolase [Xanthobacteraceae bacterium]|nr:alpha/beta hydrolase [Xanthobacteraceae bacterium]MBV9238676.1 alpha/beta hydrolase [Xanthobacteraceae bacterium]MBV9631094.1 alpha/beta hydrolase [Xanthobacteraceae bacterium]